MIAFVASKYSDANMGILTGQAFYEVYDLARKHNSESFTLLSKY